MKVLEVGTEKPYLIKIGKGILRDIGRECATLFKSAEKVLVVTDSNVARLYLNTVKSSIETNGFAVYDYVFSAGEESKTVHTYIGIVEWAAECGLCRDDVIVALGGGVVGDLAGFAAATYMRGIRYLQVPTTLLAAIDSSIGGKTGFDLKYGKNLIGAFHQPSGVYFDTEVLKTLPEKERKNGFGEGVKYAVLAGGAIRDILLKGLSDSDTEEFCALCAAYKADVVARDEKEGGLRQLLNLGHTIAHAEEKLSHYTVAHGESVAAGIKIMSKAAYNVGKLKKAEYDEIIEMLELSGLDREPQYTVDDLVKAATSDKKVHNDGINVVTVAGIGNCHIEKMSFEQFREYIK